METESNGVTICFYLGKKCRYGEDAPPEEQMECSQCPVWIMWQEMFIERTRRDAENFSQNNLTDPENDLDS